MATTQLRPAEAPLEATYRNLSTAELYEHAIRNGEGMISAHGSLVVRTGKHTGRSPRDKFVVREPSSRAKVWWGPVNQPISEEHYDRLRARLIAYMADRPIYSQDLYIGAHPDHRRSLRVYTETAWASIFARNLFRRPPLADLDGLRAELHDHRRARRSRPIPATEGVRSETAILVHLGADGDHHRRHRVRRRDQEVGLHGHELPAARRGRAADALVGERRRGRTIRPSSSASRARARRRCPPIRSASLIGDDEHGWGADGLFNFEGGCYAKTIRLSSMYEPDIFATTRRFGTILENVDLDPATRELDLDSERLHREHPRRVPARVHRQRRSDRHHRPSAKRRSS